MVTVDRSVPRNLRQVRECDDIGDGSGIDERGPSCDRKSGQGKALDRRESRNGVPTKMDECSAFPQITWAFGSVAACFKYPRSRRTTWRSSRCASNVWPVRRSSLCRHHEAAVVRNTRKTPVCMGMPFIRKDRPESGPNPSEGPQRPSFVSHKTRRTLSLFPAPLGTQQNRKARYICRSH